MRNVLTKLALVAGASIALASCGGSETANTTDNTMMSDMNTAEPMEGTTNDMTAVDGAAMDNSMMMDNSSSMAMDNSMSMDNSAMSNGTMNQM